MEDITDRLRELTDVDFLRPDGSKRPEVERERDSAVSEQAQLHSLLTQFMENEARSGSMDFGCITPLYAYRMFGGQYSMDNIESGLTELRKQGVMNIR